MMVAKYCHCFTGQTPPLSYSVHIACTKRHKNAYIQLVILLLALMLPSRHCSAGNSNPTSTPNADSLLSDPTVFLEFTTDIFYQIDQDQLIKYCNQHLTEQQSLDRRIVAKLYYGRAIAYHRNGNYRLAKSDYDDAVKHDPNNNTIRCDRDICLVALGDKDGALTDIQSVLKADPKLPYAHALASSLYLASGNRDACLRHANMAIELDEKNAEGYYLRALVLISNGSPKEALTDINRCIVLAPILQHGPIKSSAPYELRGGLRLLQRNHSLALADYSMGRHLDPSSFFAWHGLCATYYEMKQYHLSRYCSEQFVKLHPLRSVPYQDLAASLAKLNLMDSALKTAMKALDLDVKDSGSHFQVASIAALANKYDLAIKHYTLSRELAPERTSSIKRLIFLLSSCAEAKHRDGKKALQLARTLCADDRLCDAESLMCLSVALAECGLFEEAIDCITKARDRPFLDPLMVEDCAKFLKLFEQKKPFRLKDLRPYFPPVAR